MKKLLFLGFLFALSQANLANATESYYYRYGTAPSHPESYRPAPQLAQPTPNNAQYGFYQNRSNRVSNQYSNQYPPQYANQLYVTGGNPYAATYRTANVNQNSNSYYGSPVFTPNAPNIRPQQRVSKLYYLGVHGGLGATLGWDNSEHKPIKPVFGLVAGTWAAPDIRLDAEFDYHLKGTLVNNRKERTTYRQYDFGANAYYDFPMTQYGFRPFVGGGLWLVKKMATTQNKLTQASTSHSGWKLGLSASAGVFYPINESLRLSSMLRARYIITNESLYNIEALVGAYYSF